MKKRLLLLTLVLLQSLLPLTARADVVIEPENAFYQKNRREIIELGRSFLANSDDGGVPVKEAPGAGKDEGYIENGEVAYVRYSCLYGGEYWGYIYERSGWVRLDMMLVVYDYVTFEEEHITEFYPYAGDFKEIADAGAAAVWPWPGADAPLWTFEGLAADSLSAAHAYRDAEHREWIFVPYIYGQRNIWICVSEPLSREIPGLNPAKQPAVWVPDTAHVDLLRENGGQAQENGGIKAISGISAWVIVLVAGVVSGTAVLIWIVWRPDKNKLP